MNLDPDLIQNTLVRENIFLKGSLLGYSKKYLDDKFDEIVEFSELGDFIDVPLKNYSTGMTAQISLFHSYCGGT